MKYPLYLLMLITFSSCGMFEDMQAMKQPRYEIADQQAAVFCSSCHKEIYQQWLSHSRHAIATTADSFHHLKDVFTSNIVYNAFMGETMCYACHGSKEINEGVNCQTCHGAMPAKTSIEAAHESKYRPGLAALKQAEFCAKCHDVKNPVSGERLLATHDEWSRSPAAKADVSCQHCHMQKHVGQKAYHGFDSMVRNESIYVDDLNISEINFNFPQLNMFLENRVKGHPVPAGGPTRTLALEVSCQDEKGNELYKTVQTFAKKFSLMPIVGIMPYKLIENTQLQPGENRALQFALPLDLMGEINKVIIVLRMYEVSDEHQGNIEQAHWESRPIIRKEISI